VIEEKSHLVAFVAKRAVPCYSVRRLVFSPLYVNNRLAFVFCWRFQLNRSCCANVDTQRTL